MKENRVDLSVILLTSPGDLSWIKLIQDFSLLSSDSEVILVGSKPQSDLVDSSAKKSDFADRVHWIHAPEDRATQLNLALQKSKNRWIWILQPDCRVSSQALSAMEESIQEHPEALHYSDIELSEDAPAIAQLNTWASWLRSRALGLPFGSQGLCGSREVFDQLGGFHSQVEGQEDVDFVFRAKLKRIPIRAVRAPLLLNGKKYALQGCASTTQNEMKLAWNKTIPRYLDYFKKRWLGSSKPS